MARLKWQRQDDEHGNGYHAFAGRSHYWIEKNFKRWSLYYNEGLLRLDCGSLAAAKHRANEHAAKKGASQTGQ